MHQRIGTALTIATLAFLVACGQAPGIQLTLSSNAATVVRGESITLDVTVARSGSVGTVNLSLSGVPAGVTASFADDALAAGETSTTLTIVVTPAATDGAATVTVNAVADGTAKSSDVVVTVASLTVEGRLLDLLGNGFAGAQVEIQGTTTTTDATGTFSISGVAVPYDLVTYVAAPSPGVHAFVGMTAANPDVLSYAVLNNATYPETTVEGNLPGAVPANHRAIVCVEGITVVVIGCQRLLPAETAYSVFASWADGGTVDVRVHALLIEQDADGFPVAYPGYATATGSITDGVPAMIHVGAPAAPSTATLSATMNPPSGFGPDYYGVVVEASDTFSIPVVDVLSPPSASFSVPVPVFPDATYGIFASARPVSGSASSNAWRFDLAAGSATTFTLAAPPAPASPTDGATGIGTRDTLSLTGEPDGAVTFLAQAFPHTTIAVTTMSSSARIPDLAPFGAALPAAAGYTWAGFVTPGVATIDDAAAQWIDEYYEAFLAVNNGGPGAQVGAIVVTDGRTFTTP